MTMESVPPMIHSQITHLISNFPLPIKVDQMWSGSKNPNLLDRFSLLVPFCLDFVKWDVVFNAYYPLAPPDIIFGPDDEGFHPFYVPVDGEGEYKPLKSSLDDWNNRDPSMLLTLILQLRELYMNYQKQRIGEIDDDRLKFEISTISHREGIEMCLSSSTEKTEEVKFAVPLLDMNINEMVQGCPWKNTQKLYLQVLLPVGRKYASTPLAPRLKLVPSSHELKSLFAVEDVKLPMWLDGMCMAEYLPILEETLRQQVLESVSSIDVRQSFLEALAPVLGRPLEADPVFCRRATFLAASGVFSFMVHISLSSQFPKHQPNLFLQSTQHFNSQGLPIKSHLLTDFPWSPRWEPSQMAERMCDFLVEECLNFKKYCNESHLQQS